MTKAILFALSLTLVTTAAVQAQPAKMNMPTGSAAKTGTGVGVIRAIDLKMGAVTIQHEPIAAVGWPAMTMAFKARTPAVMRAAKVGQKVDFGVRVSGADAEVTSIKPR